VAVLPPEATYDEFRDYIAGVRGPISGNELSDLWQWRQKLQGVRIVTGAAARARMPADERDLTIREREQKIVSEAKAQGRNIEPVGSRWV
jgi:hypothetical protein